MRASKNSPAILAMWLLALAFLILAALGAVRSFSGVPHWDSWASYVDFYFKAQEGGWRAWWAQHNEHRIVLSRLLFWADMAWLQGSMWLLIVANFLLVLAAFLTWRAIVRELAGRAQADHWPVKVLLAFIFMCLFSWMQRENLVWEFQSQFVMAQWLPLLALWLLYRSMRAGPASTRWFIGACVVGVLCIGTMANGVLALPLMAGCALWMRMGWRRVLLLSALSVACIAIYWMDLQRVSFHGQVSDAASVRIHLLIQYVLLYLGAPFHHVFGGPIVVAQIFGAVFVFLVLRKTWLCARAPRSYALQWSLLFYLAYIGATAIGTGLGRLLLGVEQAVAGRYATPALMAWIAVLVLHQPWLLRQLENRRLRVVLPLVLLLVALVGFQWTALQHKDDDILERQVGALAMVMGVKDAQRISRTYYDMEGGIDIARRAAAAQRSVYASAALAPAVSVGQLAGLMPSTMCRAGILERTGIAEDSRYARVDGWLIKPPNLDEPSGVRVVGSDGAVLGYAVIAGRRSALARGEYGLPAEARFFRGYVAAGDTGGRWTLEVLGSGCAGKLDTVSLRIDAVAGFDAAGSTVGADQVLTHQGWDGADFERSHAPGLQVLGTYVQGDADTGSVRMRLRRGDRLLLRTGPVNAHLRYRIDDGKAGSGLVPLAQAWSALVFDDPALAEQFEFSLSDDGANWGEWMAIAVRTEHSN